MREAAYFELPFIDDMDSILRPSFKTRPPLSYFYIALTRLCRSFILSPLEGIIARNRKYVGMNKKYQSVPGRDPFFIPSSLIDGHWSMTQGYLDMLVTFFQRHNVQVLITDLSVSSLRPDSGSSYHTYARDVDERVSAWAQENKLPFFSLLPVIRQAFQEQDTAEVMIKGDGHPTNDTHARIEAALRPWLLQNLKQRRNSDL